MDAQARQELLAAIQAFVGRHQAATDELEDAHFDRCIDEAQQTDGHRHTLSPFLPTKPEDVASFVELLDVGPHTLILDLGCGDGRVLTATALLRRSRGVGVDISEECIALARSIAAAEGMGAADGLVAFHPLDLLAREPALAFLQAHAQAIIDQPPSGDGAAVQDVVVFLYVYPTLLARLDGLIDDLGRGLAGLSASIRVKVATLTYHFPPEKLPNLVRRASADGRFVVYALPE